MNSPSAQFVTSGRMSMYDPIHQICTWEDFKSNVCPNAPGSMVVEMDMKLDNQSESTSHEPLGPSNKLDQGASKLNDKVLRRLAQNREAARKSRLRKKAYVQQLETSRLKLFQLEEELERARQQGQYIGGGLNANHLGCSGSMNSDVAAFDTEYGHWVEEQNRQTCKLRSALSSDITEIELRFLVDGCLKHYSDLFHIKANAAKADVFYIMSGMWKTSTERFFLWIGGFRPSEVLKVILPQLDLADQQLGDMYNLRLSCQQAEDALSQGMDKLQLILAETLAAGLLGEGSYNPQVNVAMEKLEALVSFVNQKAVVTASGRHEMDFEAQNWENFTRVASTSAALQADHIRQETLQQMFRILTTREAARGLLALGEYCQRLRALSSIWATRPREPA